jgi:hypothetical protein
MIYRFLKDKSIWKESRLCFDAPRGGPAVTTPAAPSGSAERTEVEAATREALTELRADISTIDRVGPSFTTTASRLPRLGSLVSLDDRALRNFDFSVFEDENLVVNIVRGSLNYRNEDGNRVNSLPKDTPVVATGKVKFFRVNGRLIPFLQVKRNLSDPTPIGYMAEPYLKLAPGQTISSPAAPAATTTTTTATTTTAVIPPADDIPVNRRGRRSPPSYRNRVTWDGTSYQLLSGVRNHSGNPRLNERTGSVIYSTSGGGEIERDLRGDWYLRRGENLVSFPAIKELGLVLSINNKPEVEFSRPSFLGSGTYSISRNGEIRYSGYNGFFRSESPQILSFGDDINSGGNRG